MVILILIYSNTADPGCAVDGNIQQIGFRHHYVSGSTITSNDHGGSDRSGWEPSSTNASLEHNITDKWNYF